MRKLFLFLLLASPVFGQVNVIVPPSGTLTVQGSLSAANYSDPILSGEGNAESLAYLFIVATPYNVGTLTNGATFELPSTHVKFAITNAGSYTIFIPTNTTAGYYLIEGISASAVDPAVITLPNAAIRPAAANNITITNLTVQAGSAIQYFIGLGVTNSTGVNAGLKYVDAEGDIFTQAVAANQVSFSPSGNLVATDVQAAIIEIDNEKLSTNDVSTVGRTGLYSDLIGEPPTSSLLSVYAAGTVYQLTDTPALLNFGTTDPSLPVTITGFYRVVARANLKYNAATFASPSVVTLSIRNPNGNQVANSSTDITTLTSTTNLSTFAVVMLPVVGYNAGSTTNSLQLWGSIDVLPSAGSVDVVEASIHIERIETFSVVDATPPTVTGATVSTNGQELAIALSENVQFGAGGSGGFTITPSGGAATLSSPTIGSSLITYLTSRVIATNETLTLDYTQPGSGVEDLSGNDLASFTGTNVVNNSWESGFTPFTIGTDGSDYMTMSSLPAGIVDANKFTLSMWVDFTDAASDGVNQDLVWMQSSHFFVRKTTTNTFHIRAQTTGGTTLLEAASSVTKTASSNWFHFFMTVNLTNSSLRSIQFDGVEDSSATWATYNSGTMDIATTLNRIGAGSSGLNSMRAAMCEFYMSDRNLTNSAAFRSGSNKPISLGSNGQTPDGSAPGYYFSLVGGGSSWVSDSSGNGNNFTLTGSFSTPSPP